MHRGSRTVRYIRSLWHVEAVVSWRTAQWSHYGGSHTHGGHDGRSHVIDIVVGGTRDGNSLCKRIVRKYTVVVVVVGVVC